MAVVPVAAIFVAAVSMAMVPVAVAPVAEAPVAVAPVAEVSVAAVSVAVVPVAVVSVAVVPVAVVPVAVVPVTEVSMAVVSVAVVTWLFLQSMGGVNAASKQNACCVPTRSCCLSSLPHGFPPGPTKCEVERFTATDFGHAYIPSCHRNGDFEAVQCQRGGPCWCVDAQGKEVPGTRRQDAALPCGGSPIEGVLLGSPQVLLLCFSRPPAPGRNRDTGIRI